MHPAVVFWWNGSGCDSGSGDGPGEGRTWRREWSQDEGDGGGPFGVRRPLRFLAAKLDLDAQQVAEFARVLNELKTERAQDDVDNRRTVSALAAAVVGDGFDEARASDGAKLR